jgi:hypothetical protein
MARKHVELLHFARHGLAILHRQFARTYTDESDLRCTLELRDPDRTLWIRKRAIPCIH